MVKPEKPALRALLLGSLVLVAYYCVQKNGLTDYGGRAHLAYLTESSNRPSLVTGAKTTAAPSSTTPLDEASNSSQRYIVKTSGCKIPDFDLFDDSVRGYYKKVGRYGCKGKASFIRLVNKTTPVIDEAALLKTFKLKPVDVQCFYEEIYRNESIPIPDKTFFFAAKTALVFGKPLTVEYSHVFCLTKEKMFHEEFMLVPLLKPDVEKRCENARKDASDPGSGLNVLILGMDSVSRLNFNRHLVKTGQYVRETLKAYELFGYNKVGLNSYPNQTPLLTGLSGDEATKICGKSFYDDLVFLWDLYREKGYRTVFYEEQPKYGLYTYNAKGLKHSPTDYYMRHAIMAIDASKLKKNSYCLGPKPPIDYYLDYTLNLIDTFGARPFFAYVWMSELAHDHLNMAGHSDEPFREALEKLHDSGVLNKTVLVFISDHGIRFGSLRQTYIGRFEDSLPYGFLVFPDWFLRQHPDFAAALKVNQRRLATHFDVHATLLQLVNATLPKTVTKHGQSLFYELPENRTCESASVPSQFCTCVETEQFPVKHPLSTKIARFVLATVNALMMKELKGSCEEWKLKEVLGIRFYPSDDSAANSKGNTTDSSYWVKLSAIPRDALFEATVKHSVDWKVSSFSLVQQADRLDWYSSHSKCARGNRLEKYCYCKKK